MSKNRMKLGALLCVVAVGIAVASTAGAARQGVPGVTAHTITIGGTFPLTGTCCSLYKTITYAEQAYFGYINSQGGVHGRTIIDKVKDDQYDPSQTVPAVKDLVENTPGGLFAIVGSLGTEPGKQTMAYLNQNKVPQVLLASGDAYWGQCAMKPFHPIANVCPSRRPWTMGWQPDYPGEGALYAKYILAHQNNPKIGILEQGDAYGANYEAGFRKGLGSHHQSAIVGVETYDAQTETFSDIQTAIGKLFQKGATTIVLFTTPKPTIQSLLVLHGAGFTGPTFVNNVSANRIFILNAEQACNCAIGPVISSTYIKSNSVDPTDPAMQLAKNIIYATGDPGLKHQFDIGDSNLIYGLGVAYTFVDALKRAGQNPTRASFMKAIRSLQETGQNANPFLYPGMLVRTNGTKETFPMTQLALEQWNAGMHPSSSYGPGDWNTISNVLPIGH